MEDIKGLSQQIYDHRSNAVAAHKSMAEALQVVNAKIGMLVGWLGERSPSQPPTICGWLSELADTEAVLQAMANRAHELASKAAIASSEAKDFAAAGVEQVASLVGKLVDAAGEAALKVKDEAFLRTSWRSWLVCGSETKGRRLRLSRIAWTGWRSCWGLEAVHPRPRVPAPPPPSRKQSRPFWIASSSCRQGLTS